MQRKPVTTDMRGAFEDALASATRPLSPLQRMVLNALRKPSQPSWRKGPRRRPRK